MTFSEIMKALFLIPVVGIAWIAATYLLVAVGVEVRRMWRNK